MSPLEFLVLPPSTLYHYWPSFIEPGLQEIKTECRTDWQVEEHYASIFHSRAECFLMQREGRWLGFFDAYPVPLSSSSTGLKYFLWAIWSVPPRDRTEEDRALIKQDREATIEFIVHRARELQCNFIETNSPRFFHTKLGFEEYSTIYRREV